MNIELLKKKIQNNLNQKVEEFVAREDIRTRFGHPQLAYVDADHKVYDTLFMEGFTDHPKKIYRPGKCIITYFLPWGEEVQPGTPEWSRAFSEAIWLCMELNRSIRKDLDSVGRLHSLLCNMMAWNRNQHREDWDFRLTAALGGLGEIGPCGCFRAYNAEPGFSRIGGRCSGVITDGLYAGQLPEDRDGVANRLNDERAKAVLAMARSMNCAGTAATGVAAGDSACGSVAGQESGEFAATGGAAGGSAGGSVVGQESGEFAATGGGAASGGQAGACGGICPGNAIGRDGIIDRTKCQEHCLTINENLPCPEVCGRCFGK